MKKQFAMGHSEKTENQAEQDKSHAVAGVEAYPTPPHGCFLRNDRCNLAHADLQCGVTGREVWAPERIDEVDDSERKGNACTKNHENFCSQDALLFCGALQIPFSFATISLLARDAPQYTFYAAARDHVPRTQSCGLGARAPTGATQPGPRRRDGERSAHDVTATPFIVIGSHYLSCRLCLVCCRRMVGNTEVDCNLGLNFSDGLPVIRPMCGCRLPNYGGS